MYRSRAPRANDGDRDARRDRRRVRSTLMSGVSRGAMIGRASAPRGPRTARPPGGPSSACARPTTPSPAVLSGADLRDEDLSQDRLDDADLGVRTAPARESGARARCSDTVRLREARPRASPRGDAPSRAAGRRPSALGRPARRGPAQRNLDQREAPGGGAARREPARRRPAAGERRGCCGHARHAVSPAKRAMPEGPARALGTGKTSMSATRTAVPPNRTALTLEFAPRPRAHLISQAHPPRHAARHVLEDLDAIRTWLIPVRCGARSWRAARRADAVTAG
jgi:hypothetical protein